MPSPSTHSPSLLQVSGLTKGHDFGTSRLKVLNGRSIEVAPSELVAISVVFSDRFTLFDYRFVLPADGGISVVLLAVITCSLAALHPARIANRISSAESLHYE